MAAIPPSGRQYVISHGTRRAVITEVGGGLRTYTVDGEDVIDGYAEDEMCSAARGAPLLPWPNRLQDGRCYCCGEQIELVLGDGILSWKRGEEGSIYHPILLQRIQLAFDPSVPEFTLIETGKEVELYSALFRSMPDVEAKVLARCREGDHACLWCRRLGGREQALGHRLGQDGVEGAAQQRAQRTLLVDALGERGVGRNHRLDLGPRGRVELVVDVGEQQFVGNLARHADASCAPERIACKVSRARASRLVSVPIGMPSTSAASL